MSPISEAVESLAARYGVPVLEAQEYYLERAGIRQHSGGMSESEADSAAIGDLEIWAKLWISIHGDRGPQLNLVRK